MQIIIALTAVVAGIIQGVTGFGAGIVMMMALPNFFAVNTSAGVSTCICLLLTLTMVITYRKNVNFKEIIPPSILYIATCSASMYLSKFVNAALMKKILGGFLVILAIYFLFLNKGSRKKLSLPVKIFCIMVSAICDGLFGVGGPLMVIYFMSQCHSTHEYLGTIQTFFLINCTYNTIFRIINGIIGPEHIVVILCGIAGILAGGFVGGKLVKKLDGNIIRKATYVMIGIAGIVNLI